MEEAQWLKEKVLTQARGKEVFIKDVQTIPINVLYMLSFTCKYYKLIQQLVLYTEKICKHKKKKKFVALYMHVIWKHILPAPLQLILTKWEKYNISRNYIYSKKKSKSTLKIAKIDIILVSLYSAQQANFNIRLFIQNINSTLFPLIDILYYVNKKLEADVHTFWIFERNIGCYKFVQKQLKGDKIISKQYGMKE